MENKKKPNLTDYFIFLFDYDHDLINKNALK